jgi:hypothetical protein
MSTWNYSEIRRKVRNLTGRPDASMMTDATLLKYINKYYQFVLPKELKIMWGYTYYKFYTQPNVDQYVGPINEFQTLNPQVWVDGFPIEWFLSPDTFYSQYPQQMNKAVIGTSDGSIPTFAFTISAYPVIRGSVYVSDGVTVAQDDGAGGFLAPNSGTINYISGVVSVTFSAQPAANASISVTSQTYQPNRPQSILYYQSSPLADSTVNARDLKKVFVLRPIPDQTYEIKMQGIQLPMPFVNDGDVPFREDLGPLIAYGASIEIFEDFNQTDQVQEILPSYNRYKDISMQDTYEELLYERALPAF